MIYSETIEIVYSDVEITPVYSTEDPDYRRFIGELRETEQNDLRDTEDGNKRLLE